MKTKAFLFAAFIFTTNLFGQTFADDWRAFENKDFNLSFDLIHEQMWNETSYGKLTFMDKKDSTIRLEYHAFLLADTDSIFYGQIHDWYFRQSCSSLGEAFRSFDHGKFHYYLEPCDNCGTLFNKRCAELLAQVKKFVTGYPKP